MALLSLPRNPAEYGGGLFSVSSIDGRDAVDLQAMAQRTREVGSLYFRASGAMPSTAHLVA